MNQKAVCIITMLTVATLGLIILNGCVPGESLNETSVLAPAEIREYEGTKLSSIDNFRENSILGPQLVNRESYQLMVNGLVENPASYSYDEVINDYKNYKKVVTLDCVEGWSVTVLWEGILVKDLIETSRPLDSSTVVIFHAYDGYTTSFPVEYVMDNDILLAHKMNEVVLPEERGYPFQLVAESKWGYKWIKWITRIELSDNIDYRGYWESRGYSNSADLDAGFFE
jgi:DMSO/TMAO reductase YedYZ molybdopterin-dependent catalytic subunit